MKENYEAETENIIALCHIIDDFEEFQKRLLSVISFNYNRDFVEQLRRVSTENSKIFIARKAKKNFYKNKGVIDTIKQYSNISKFINFNYDDHGTLDGNLQLGRVSTENSKIFVARKAKKFYYENKGVIDTINQYSNISKFINFNYDDHGTPDGNLQFFYGYISHHNEKIEQILEVLVKLKNLGFDNFEFNKDLDFTKEIYAFSTIDDTSIEYVANPQVLPSYEGDTIRYKTTDSHYKMKLGIEKSDIDCNEMPKWDRSIILNSLLFDVKSIPTNISKETIIDPLIKEKEEQTASFIRNTAIRNTANLSKFVSNLEQQINSAEAEINSLDIVHNIEDWKAILANIQANIEKLEVLSREYDSRISKQESLLTSEIQENEETLYLKRQKNVFDD